MLILLFSWMDKFGAFFSQQIVDPLMQKVTGIFGGTWMFWLMIAGSLLLIVFLLYLFRKQLSRFVLIRKMWEILTGIAKGLKTIYKMERKWEFLLHSVLIWLCYILMTWVVVFSLPETSGLTLIDGVFLLVIGGLGMSAPVTAGFGAFHWIVSRGLVYVYGLDLAQGGAYAILAHESNSIFTVLLGALSYLLLMLSQKKNNKS
jgi:hypothetical protein